MSWFREYRDSDSGTSSGQRMWECNPADAQWRRRLLLRIVLNRSDRATIR